MIKKITELEDNLNKKDKIIENLNKDKDDLLIRIKDLKQELELNKQSINILNEQHLNENEIETHNLNQLNNKLSLKDYEIEELNKKHAFEIKELNDKIIKLNEKIESFKEKEQINKNYYEENLKLKLKCKELMTTKEHMKDYEDLKRQIEKKNRLIESYKKDLNDQRQEIEKNNKELNDLNEKLNQNDQIKKKYKYELQEMEKDYNRLLTQSKRRDDNRESILKRAPSIFFPNNAKNLMEINNENLMDEIEKTVEDRIKTLTLDVNSF